MNARTARKAADVVTRDPVRTRRLILDAARTLLAREGRDALNVRRVAELADVNRGTAYLHFASREELTQATLEDVSRQLAKTVLLPLPVGDVTSIPISQWRVKADELAQFAMNNPALGQIWLNYILTSEQVRSDPFWLKWVGATRALARSGYAHRGVDSEVLAVVLLASYFTWPIWAEAHSAPGSDRSEMGRRLSSELLRLIGQGVLLPEYEKLIGRRDKRPRTQKAAEAGAITAGKKSPKKRKRQHDS
ncbi:TetR/AcrR family transcriptional regulator [Sinimarinibacterium flocculans]|uniref:TetR/AcrR family transcriptional regulator n=1 Tax=Sinimarinibacterium flocculans TaxID=985250 RepID=UPI002492136B|nr:TetR/AcrR family transcriptional regulator [Sinimarinibacterium flocculans]